MQWLEAMTLLGNFGIQILAHLDLGTCSSSPLGCPVERWDQGSPSRPGKSQSKRVADFPPGQHWLNEALCGDGACYAGCLGSSPNMTGGCCGAPQLQLEFNAWPPGLVAS